MGRRSPSHRMGWPVWFAAAANRNFQVAARSEKAEGGAFRSRRGAKGRKAELSGRGAERKGGRRSFQVAARSEKAEGGAFRSRRGAKRRKAELSGRDAERKGGRRSFQVVTRSKN